MAIPKNRKKKSRTAVDDTFPSKQERLPLLVQESYQVAMGTHAEIVSWLRVVPRNSHVILISFSNEASFKKHGLVFWHVACQLTEIVGRIRRRRFEQLVDALVLLKPRQDQYPQGIKRRHI